MSATGREFDPVATALSSIKTASSIPISEDELARLLRTGRDEPSHLLALFGDVDLYTLLRLAKRFDVDGETLARAYRGATPPRAAPSSRNSPRNLMPHRSDAARSASDPFAPASDREDNAAVVS